MNCMFFWFLHVLCWVCVLSCAWFVKQLLSLVVYVNLMDVATCPCADLCWLNYAHMDACVCELV